MTKTLGRGDDSEFDILCEPCVTAEKGKIQQRMKRPMSESDNHMFVGGGNMITQARVYKQKIIVTEQKT